MGFFSKYFGPEGEEEEGGVVTPESEEKPEGKYIGAASDRDLREHWDSIEAYFTGTPDPLDLLCIEYHITSAKIKVDFNGVKLILRFQEEGRSIYCGLPHDGPADLQQIIGALQGNELVQKMMRDRSDRRLQV